MWGCSKITDIGVAKLLRRNIAVIGKDQFAPVVDGDDED